MGDRVANIFATFLIVALATTLVLPGRETGNITREFFGGVSKATNSVIGRG
jgi:hypothetical protein